MTKDREILLLPHDGEFEAVTLKEKGFEIE
jgi:hypothetical protein